jgi:hypothetical protein
LGSGLYRQTILVIATAVVEAFATGTLITYKIVKALGLAPKVFHFLGEPTFNSFELLSVIGPFEV